MTLTERLRQKADPIWQKIFAHPFVTGIGDGTLPVEKFRFYIRQDYAFLIDYSRLLALAAAKAPDLESMGRFAALLDATLNREMPMHRGFAARFGVSAAELAATTAAPTTYAYTRHLLEVAALGSMPEIVTALLPCQWGYCDIGRMLARKGKPVSSPLYAEWIDMYASTEFAELGEWLRSLLNALSGTADEERLVHIFLTSSRYEYLFWEMADHLEEWPV